MLTSGLIAMIQGKIIHERKLLDGGLQQIGDSYSKTQLLNSITQLQ